tara:strand:+ start:133 stop:1686 length:1554 start_codon:yes stop_codon:yes gene_type:complete
MVSNEVYTGAGASATMIPEADYNIGMQLGTTDNGTNRHGFKYKNTGNSDTVDRTTISWGDDATGGSAHVTNRLPAGIYQGCLAEVRVYNSSNVLQSTSTLVIKNNTSYQISFNQELSSTDTDIIELTILGFGTPAYSPAVIDNKNNLLADNWLGLVNTITPPTVDAEMKQVNLALGGTRNFGLQYKGAETLGSASIDVSLNNGSWLYYVLGKKTFTAASDGSLNTSAVNGKVYYDDTNKTFHRREGNTLSPPATYGTADASLLKWNDAKVEYTFTESETGLLPSFALEITNEKGNVTDANYFQDANDERLFSRIFTGCQVNSFTMNFEEGQEVTASIDALSRYAYDSLADYIPKRRVRTPSSLFNHNAEADNLPFMFSDGHLEAFGQTLARVKSGSLTISNNLAPQRYIGNYSRKIVSANNAAQRTYEVTLNLQVTDRTIWDELRKSGESTLGNIKLEFDKNDTADTDKITMTLADYVVQSVDIPFPDDKGMLDVAVTLSARTLSECKYFGKWIIIG